MDADRLFHVTGVREQPLSPGLRPALFARFGDLRSLRYDYPAVLVPSDGSTPFAVALSGVIDELITSVAAKGVAGERMRRHLLRLEREIRGLVAEGERGTLRELWAKAVHRLAARGGAPLDEDLGAAARALTVDGPVVDCDEVVASRFVEHAWRERQRRRSAELRTRIDVLATRLADLIRADVARSQSGRSPAVLRASVGPPHEVLFDFDLMSRLLSRPSGTVALSTQRRRRIDGTIATLRAQRFVGPDAYRFTFASVQAALLAYHERLPAMVELARAIAIAELELNGTYVEAKHDLYFASLAPDSLRPEDVALFPEYVVDLQLDRADAAARARVIEALARGVPLKIVLVTDDAFGVDARIAMTATGIGDVFVLQASAAKLVGVQAEIAAALAYRGPALISVFAPRRGSGITPYLAAAAASESRAFPTFVYDPSAGVSSAARFRLLDAAPETGWRTHPLEYADPSLRRSREQVAFTPADFALTDPRHAGDFALASEQASLTPLDRWIEHGPNGSVPFVYAVDAELGLRKLVVSERLGTLAARARDAWERLREMAARAQPVAADGPADGPVESAASNESATRVVDAVSAGATPTSDEPYIETPRCTSCNECTQVNPRMFAYNENKQAYIKDVSAGTYKDLVEAAEGCQVAIIHPGKPRDPNEPGLEDLVRRAESFR